MTAPAPAAGRGGPITGGAARIGWAVMTLGALVAIALPLMAQLVFAAVMLGIVGMAHGASDVAVVAPHRRSPFVLAYLAVAAISVLWWIEAPQQALPLLLGVSALHFAMEDAPDGSVIERSARGVGLIAAPAVLHHHSFASLLTLAGGGAGSAKALALVLGGLGAAAAATLIALSLARRDVRLLAGTLALVLLPPLVGFALGFVILHAMPQTEARSRALGCRSIGSYVRAVAPGMLSAIALLAPCTSPNMLA